MKKILTLIAVASIVTLSSCTDDNNNNNNNNNYVDYNDVGVVYENTYYNFTAANNYSYRFNFPKPILQSDVVLVYRLGGVDGNKDVWEFLPQTYYFDNGTRDFSYNFNFSASYVNIFLSGNELQIVPDADRLRQIFRIVVVPANFAGSLKNASYLEVVKTLKLNDSQIHEIKL